MITEMKVPALPLLTQVDAGRKELASFSMEKLHGSFDKSEKRIVITATTIPEILNDEGEEEENDKQVKGRRVEDKFHEYFWYRETNNLK